MAGVEHEWKLVEQTVTTLSSLAAGKRVKEVEIALGPGVDRVRAIAAWRSITGSTPFATTHVTWELAAALLRCERCQHEFFEGDFGICPYCGGDGVVIHPAAPISVGRWVLEDYQIAKRS